MNNLLKIPALAGVFLLSLSLIFTSCKKEDPPVPTISLSLESFKGKVGEKTSTIATVNALAGFKSLRVTKYVGTTIDNTFGTAGVLSVTSNTYALEYTLAAEGLTAPIRFNFTGEDLLGRTVSTDFVITTDVSVKYLLTTFNWQWSSKLGKIFSLTEAESEQILACEKDNFYIFAPDGTMKINYGAVTGTGGGTCDFDGLRVETKWSLNADETVLTIDAVNVFNTSDVQKQVYKIKSFSTTEIRSTQNVDLTVFGGIAYDWTYVWKVKAK
jgi:hypothetical protein